MTTRLNPGARQIRTDEASQHGLVNSCKAHPTAQVQRALCKHLYGIATEKGNSEGVESLLATTTVRRPTLVCNPWAAQW